MNVEQRMKSLDSGVLPIQIVEGKILILDQRKLPERKEFFDATELDRMCYAIKEMVVRGAPSIGVAAAFGLASEARRIAATKIPGAQFLTLLDDAKHKLQELRPTAVNLRWATEKIYARAKFELDRNGDLDQATLAEDLFQSVLNLLEEHEEKNRALGDFGATLIDSNASVMTHCNAGPLAACGWGTALGVIRSAFFNGVKLSVIVGETRPRNQGARLTMWELHQDGIPASLITDSMAGYLMATHRIDIVIVGADRIAANGDTANKIGTYNLAVLAKYHDIPFYVAAPLSTFDPSIANGTIIPIEERDLSEVTMVCDCGSSHTVFGAKAINPAFDVTPAHLISGIVTEVGILRPPYEYSIGCALARDNSGLE